MTRKVPLLFCLLFCCLFAFGASAAESANITAQTKITASGIETALLTDGSLKKAAAGENVTLTLQAEVPMGGIWLLYHDAPQGGMLNGETPLGEHGFWSEYIPLAGAASAVLTFDAVAICELYVYAEGELPKEVQCWEVGDKETDLLLFSAHSDDDQLFFAGLIPYYAARGDLCIRVCMFTTPYQDISRVQELLAGLWHCGLTVYPTVLPYTDAYSESLDVAKQQQTAYGHAYDTILADIRALVNEYQPLVAVLHDFKGEYGHGQHLLATAAFVEAMETAGEADFVPEKIYVHLYGENKIVLPIDEPLEFFGGKSAFTISQEAFRYHKSQHWTWFYGWLYGEKTSITRAEQIKWYNPAYYGLYYSRVGTDSGNDMFEHIVTYAERRRAKQEAAAEEAAWQRAACAWTRVEERLAAREADALRRAEARSAYLAAMANTSTEPSAANPPQKSSGQLLLFAVIFAAGVVVVTIALSVCVRIKRKRR